MPAQRGGKDEAVLRSTAGDAAPAGEREAGAKATLHAPGGMQGSASPPSGRQEMFNRESAGIRRLHAVRQQQAARRAARVRGRCVRSAAKAEVVCYRQCGSAWRYENRQRVAVCVRKQ